jgi:hypothetical protein
MERAESFATIPVARMHGPGEEINGFLLHPGLIDACIQILIAMLPPTHVPLSIDVLTGSALLGAPPGQ